MRSAATDWRAQGEGFAEGGPNGKCPPVYHDRGDRTFKLGSGSTSEYGRYVKFLRGVP